MRETSGYTCPSCGHDRQYLLDLALDGSFVRLLCQSCEHTWTE